MAESGNRGESQEPVITKIELKVNNKDDEEDSYLVNDEYETQLFGFTPSSFTDKMYNIYFDYNYEGLQKLQSTLIEKCCNIMSEAEIRDSCDKILETCVQKLDKNFDRLEVYVKRNILNIPKNAVLPEDEIHETARAQARTRGEAPNFTHLEMEYENIKSQLAREVRRKAQLDKTLKEQDMVLNNLRDLEDQVALVKKLEPLLDISP